ncbi:MAG: beta strand repeat-containing protein, partial [Planctomycetales bacterium]
SIDIQSADIRLGANLTTTSTNLTLGGNVTVADGLSPTLTTGAGAGTIQITGSLDGTAGATAESLTLTAGTGDVILDGVGTAGVDDLESLAVTSAANAQINGEVDLNSSLMISANSVTLGDDVVAGAVVDVTAADGSITVQGVLDTSNNSSDVNLTATAGVLLDGAGADVTTGGGNFTVDADSNSDGTGTYSQDDAGSAVTTTNGTVSITAGDVSITGTIDAGTGAALIAPSTPVSIGLGGAAGTFTLTDAMADQITASRLEIGTSISGEIAIDDFSPANFTTLVLRTDEGVSQGTVDAGIDVTIANLAIDSDTGVDIDANVTTLAINNADAGSNVQIDSSSTSLTIGSVTTSAGALAGITTAGGSINVEGATAITVDNALTSNGGDVVLTTTTGDLTVNDGVQSAAGTITLTADDDLTISANVMTTAGNGAIDLNAGTNLVIDSAAIVSTVGNGAITGDAVRSIDLRDNVVMETIAGDITLTANRGATQTAGNFDGIELTSSTIETDSGSILLTGRGGNEATGNSDGVFVDSSTISSTGAGTIELIGEATNGGSSDGVDVDADAVPGTPSLITSVTGAITITGTSSVDSGIEIQDGSVVSSTGTGAATITINGTVNGATGSDGVYIIDAGTTVTSVDGNISITGNTIGSTTSDHGIQMESGSAVSSTGTAQVMLNGMSSNGEGIQLHGNGTLVTSVDGNISITGNTIGSTTSDHGIQ